jgi:DUF1365 family protein
VAKQFYVSPFYPVDGRYRMSLPEPGDRLALSVVLARPDGSSRRRPGRRRPGRSVSQLTLSDLAVRPER